uniref:Uncharacterized protein n=1 Tax=Ditylenchus dipsaci TaxID=166011 RepID=A0A915E622_9BILA
MPTHSYPCKLFNWPSGRNGEQVMAMVNTHDGTLSVSKGKLAVTQVADFELDRVNSGRCLGCLMFERKTVTRAIIDQANGAGGIQNDPETICSPEEMARRFVEDVEVPTNEEGESVGNDEEADSDRGAGDDKAMDGFREAWTELEGLGEINSEATMATSLVWISGALSLSEIVEDVSRADCAGDEEMDVEQVEKPSISRLEAQRAFLVVKQYGGDKKAIPVLSLSNALDDAFYEDRQKKLKQPIITDFFKSNR